LKKKLGILIAMVMTVSLCLVPAVSAAAGTIVLGGDVATASGAQGTTDKSHMGSGCWEVAPAAGIPEGKMQIYMSPTTFPFSSLGSFTIDEIQSISYWTNKPVTTYDFYLAIYTEPDLVDDTTGWYGYRLNAEPYYSRALSEPVDVWNKWNTDAGTNQLTFFDTAKTAGGYGFYGQPSLQDLQGGTINWHDYDAAYSDQEIDYGAETVKYISFQTGSGTNDLLLGGCIDEIEIKLEGGASLIIDLEKDIVSSTLGAELEEITAISVTPSIIDFGTITPGTPQEGADIVVENIGTVTVDVSANLDPLTGTVFNFMKLGGAYSPAYSGTWVDKILNLLPSNSEILTTALDVPLTYSAQGEETATLIFIATAK
jgi:hypothetical protein